MLQKTARGSSLCMVKCEATARMGYLPAEKAAERCSSMGIAIPGGAFRLIDEEGQEIDSPNVTGELVYEGDNVTLGYAECVQDLAKGDERGGMLMTGDMARYDEDGFYYIVGRKKRFLKVYGNRVNLDEIDRLIKGRFDNMDCASAGIVFHIAPSKDFPQIGIINGAIRDSLEDRPGMRPYICLVRYGRDQKINDLFSSMADTRIIWGGDTTISEIRKSPLMPRAGEITFADRYSLAVIDSERYLASENKDGIAQGFYNDTYLMD